MPRKKNPEDIRHSFSVMLSQSEQKIIASQADAAAIPRGRFIREAALGTVVRSEADAAILRELRRLGGLCKFAITQGADRAEADAAFRALRDYAAFLCK